MTEEEVEAVKRLARIARKETTQNDVEVRPPFYRVSDHSFRAALGTAFGPILSVRATRGVGARISFAWNVNERSEAGGVTDVGAFLDVTFSLERAELLVETLTEAIRLARSPVPPRPIDEDE